MDMLAGMQILLLGDGRTLINVICDHRFPDQRLSRAEALRGTYRLYHLGFDDRSQFGAFLQV